MNVHTEPPSVSPTVFAPLCHKIKTLSLLLFAVLRKIRLVSLSAISVNIRENTERCSQLSSHGDISKPEVWEKTVFLENMWLCFQVKGAPGSRRWRVWCLSVLIMKSRVASFVLEIRTLRLEPNTLFLWFLSLSQVPIWLWAFPVIPPNTLLWAGVQSRTRR